MLVDLHHQLSWSYIILHHLTWSIHKLAWSYINLHHLTSSTCLILHHLTSPTCLILHHLTSSTCLRESNPRCTATWTEDSGGTNLGVGGGASQFDGVETKQRRWEFPNKLHFWEFCVMCELLRDTVVTLMMTMIMLMVRRRMRMMIIMTMLIMMMRVTNTSGSQAHGGSRPRGAMLLLLHLEKIVHYHYQWSLHRVCRKCYGKITIMIICW